MDNFYIILEDRYLICDIDMCAKSKKTFDIKIKDLAIDEPLLRLLNLVYIDHLNHTGWFEGYLAAFNNEKSTERWNYLKTNPTVRILVTDKELLKEVKEHFENKLKDGYK